MLLLFHQCLLLVIDYCCFINVIVGIVGNDVLLLFIDFIVYFIGLYCCPLLSVAVYCRLSVINVVYCCPFVVYCLSVAGLCVVIAVLCCVLSFAGLYCCLLGSVIVCCRLPVVIVVVYHCLTFCYDVVVYSRLPVFTVVLLPCVVVVYCCLLVFCAVYCCPLLFIVVGQPFPASVPSGVPSRHLLQNRRSSLTEPSVSSYRSVGHLLQNRRPSLT